MPIHAILSDGDASTAYGYVEKALRLLWAFSVPMHYSGLRPYDDGQIAIFPTAWGGLDCVCEYASGELLMRLQLSGPTINVFVTEGNWQGRIDGLYGTITPPTPPNLQTAVVEEDKFTGYPNVAGEAP